MKRTFLLLSIPVVLALLIWCIVIYPYWDHGNRLNTRGSNNETIRAEPVLASFSFDATVTNQLVHPYPHLTVQLSGKKRLYFNKDGLTDTPDSIPVLITVEISNADKPDRYFFNPIDKLVNGDYNDAIKQLCNDIIGRRPNVFLRVMPDMEVPVKRYPWQYYGGPEYIKAFRYFATECKKHTPQVKITWGPAGYPGTMEYYPGDDVVDVATITLKSDSEQALTAYPRNYSTQYDLFRRLHRLRFINKPILILGSKQLEANAVDSRMVQTVTSIIEVEKDVIYSDQNYNRPVLRERDGSEKDIIIGLHDPHGLLINEPQVTVEHLFVAFDNLRSGGFENDFRKAVDRGHDVIVTFEPHHLPNGEKDSCFLQHVAKGIYNDDLDYFYSVILSTEKVVYLRYAQEMEIPITRYAWQSQNPVDFIHSYRYFMNYIDPWPENIKRIWGPAGDRGSIEWYPGDAVVDYISIAIYGLPDKNITDQQMQESFSTIFNRKNWRFRFIDKPLFITEFGVKGEEEFQTLWLEEAAKVIRENPQIIGVNYFNMTDVPNAWGDIKPPDWSITKASFDHFFETLENNN